MEGDELLEGAALVHHGVVEAVHHDVGDVRERVRAPQVVGGVRREGRERILALDPPVLEVVNAARAEHQRPCTLGADEQEADVRVSRSAEMSCGCRSSISSSVSRRGSSIR